MTAKPKLSEYLPNTKKQKPTNSSLLFPELQQDLSKNLDLVGNVKGLVIVVILKNGQKVEEWFLSFFGRDKAPTISQERPQMTKSTKGAPVAIIQLEDRDLLKFITGGLPGLKALNEGRIKIVGDLTFASELESVFNNAGGVEKVKEYLKKAKLALSSKL
ncbi:hypothetical protein BC833DRAFT_582534 [Globomyces pollinis-pini]|nr:hypothetical protein BC833DRAFT_582534 [Globomyces pollinis-pini]